VSFTNDKKEEWATTFKSDLQVGKVHFPDHPDFTSQVHGIKRVRLESNRFKFSGEKDDYFWSSMLALYGTERTQVKFYLLR
jgi:hypothetical protein